MARDQKFRSKAAAVDFTNLPALALPSGGTPGEANQEHRPKTAPGVMMAFAGEARSDLLRENQVLKERADQADRLLGQVQELAADLAQWDGAKAGRFIDPLRIRRSRWANRHADSFNNEAFAMLKAEIVSAGGNVQPIKVRPVGHDEGGELYEVVFGHRRHQACLEAGLPVLSLIDNLSDAGLFVEMDRENRSRKDLSAWEQGMMYRRALDEGLFPSNRKLAEAVGADLGNVGRALALASLPDSILSAFASPLDLQFRWAKPLRDAWEADPESVRARASVVAKTLPRPTASDVFSQLVTPEAPRGCTVQPPLSLEVKVAGKRAASISMNARGATKVTIDPGLISEDRMAEFASLLERFLTPTKKKTR